VPRRALIDFKGAIVITDHQWHWVPRDLVEQLARRSSPPRAHHVDDKWWLEVADGVRLPLPPPVLLDLDEQLRIADQHGIDVVVSSPVVLGEVLHLPAAEAGDLLEETNAAMAGAQRAHPERFVGLAMLPMQEPDAARAVLQTAVADGLSGVCMLASIDGRPLATDTTLAVFEEIAGLGLPVVLHPAIRSTTASQALGMRAEIGLGWMYHTALAVVQLVESGIFDACPDLTVLHPHLGGVLPYVAGRLDRLPGTTEHSVVDCLRRNFYVDTVSATPDALRLAINTYGVDRVVFATDFPWVPIEPGLEFVRAHAAPDDSSRIFSNVLPGLRAPGSLDTPQGAN
jgi:aminocarboxymuconate-semialdehyde decarboxylase